MPWLPIPEDHCRTAADVREQRRHVVAMRMACIEKTPPLAQVVQPKQPKPLMRPLSEEERKIEEVIVFACTRFCASRAMLLGDSKTGECLYPRHTVVYLLRSVLHHNWRKIGAAVHRSDTVVISSFHRAESLLLTDPEHPVSTAIREGLRRFVPIPPPPPADPHPPGTGKNRPEIREFKPEESKQLSTLSDVTKIVNLTAEYFKIDIAVLKGDRRTSYLVTARQIAAYLCCRCTNRSTLEIGKLMQRDHSTLLYGCRRVAVQIREGNQEVITAIEHLRDVIKGAPLTPINITDFVNRTRYRTEFTKEEMKLIREMWEAGASYKEIGHRLGRTELSIDSKMKRMRQLETGKAIAKKYAVDFSKADEDKIRQLYFAGKSYKEIALATERTMNSIAKKLQRMEIRRRGKVSDKPIEGRAAVLHP